MCVRELMTLLQGNSQLCSPVLTTLENLRLTDSQFLACLPIVTNALLSAPLTDLPLIVAL